MTPEIEERDPVKYSPTVCVDYNGVLDMYAGWKPDVVYPPREGALEFLQGLNRMGYRVVILSSIEPGKVWDWLVQHGLDGPVRDVTNKKVPAIAYVDDRAVCFRGDFAEALEQLRDFKAHWEGK